MAETPGMSIEKKTLDNKIFVQETSRPVGTITYFTSRGDLPAGETGEVGTDVGHGEAIVMFHSTGETGAQELYIDLNVKENATYVHEGYLTWTGANFDSVCMEIVPKVTKSTAGSNTYFNLYGGYLIIPAAGDGTLDVQPQDIVLVESPVARDIGVRPAAFWNADYSTVTHKFSNITAAPLGNGQYNMFAVEVPLSRFANEVLLLNTGFIMLQASDSDEIGEGMRLKFHMHTNNGDHEWKCAGILTMHRTKTC